MPENHTLPRVLRQGAQKQPQIPKAIGHRVSRQKYIFVERRVFYSVSTFSEFSRFQISDVHNGCFAGVRTCQIVGAILKDIRRILELSM